MTDNNFDNALMFSENSDEVKNRKNPTLSKYAFQGGINAVNGFSGIFMVNSVSAVSGVYKAKRDERRDARSDSKKKNAEKLFTSILKDSVKESRAEMVDCQTITYGRDSKMQNYHYQTREYRY